MAALAVPEASTANTSGRCDAAEARSAFATFLVAFNHGNYGTLQALFAAEPDFAWYAVAPPHGRAGQRSTNRTTLIPFFKARHRQRELLHLLSFNFASIQQRDGAPTANFNGTLTRKANDLRIERRGFKATLRCGDQSQFVVLSIGTEII